MQHPVRDRWDTRHDFAAVGPGVPDEPNVPNNIGGSRSWLTDSTDGSVLRGTRRCLCSVRVGVLTLIWVSAKLEEIMDIRFRDTQSANASTETPLEVITGCSNDPHPDDLSAAAGIRADTPGAGSDHGAAPRHRRSMTRPA